jgi:type II secretory pathway pseudopilin PulG
MKAPSRIEQRGLSLVGLIFVLAILGMIGVLILKIVPTATEYMTVKKAIVQAKAGGTSIPEIRTSFDKQADIGYVSAISGKDLDIVKTAEGFEISFAYEKKIPLFGPASLVLDYEGTTSPTKLPPKKADE